MSVDTSGITAVQARIQAIQAQIAAVMPQQTSATSGSDFANVLGDADSVDGTTDSTTSSSTLSPQATTTSTASGSSATGSQVVSAAEKYLGVPYVFGGTTTSGLDCSGLVQKAYGDLGITLPRLSYDQAKVGTAVPSLAQAQPGDILGFGNPAYHVAIYIGNGKMIAAPEPGENVKIQDVYQTPDEIRRVVGTSTAAASTTATPDAATASSAGISAAVQQYSAQFSAAEKQYNLPSGMLAAVCQTESGGNPSAVSPAGAQGLMQFMPSTAAGLGINPLDPSQAIQGAAKMLSGLMAKYGNSVPLTLAAYNAGPGAVAQYGGIPPYTETQNYVKKITGLMAAGG